MHDDTLLYREAHDNLRGYSAWRILREGLSREPRWTPLWRDCRPKARYDVVIIGGGGHGLATAYYLAKNHGVTNTLIVERGWLGGGNTGRNTAVIRSNYYHAASTRFYDHSLRLYEKLSRELNYNIMFNQHGVINLAHSPHDLDMAARRVGAMQLSGVDTALLTTDEIARRVPALDVSPRARFPVLGGFVQKRAGSARHDAVAWGYARAASALGAQIAQGCSVGGFILDGNRIRGVATTQGEILADTVAIAVAGHSSVLASMAGFRIPITSMALQAFVSEPLKPVLDTVVLSPATGAYIGQSDRGGLVIGGPLDLYPSYAQRGNFPVVQGVMTAISEQFPSLGRVRLLRAWAGIADMAPDSSPIIGKTPITGLYISSGWGTGGFKAIPAGGEALAHHITTGKPHPLAEPFALDRFARGALVDEAAASGIIH